MNTDKLIEAIQIIVKEEVKQQLSGIIKEVVKSELKKVLAEQKKPKSEFSMAKAILEDEPIVESSPKSFSKNPMINQILNETKAAVADGGFRTMAFGQADMGSIVGRTAVAEKMGYGEFANRPQKTGLGVQTGVAELDKALNRDYSELVKRFKK